MKRTNWNHEPGSRLTTRWTRLRLDAFVHLEDVALAPGGERTTRAGRHHVHPGAGWGSAPPLENARRGQDNAVFCRVHNRGTAVASTVYVRAMVTHWASLEFVYPADFEPSTNVGAALPNPLVPSTYLIGQARIDNLAAGADQIVKFNWPQALVPPETLTVSGVMVRWHPCLLVEASPHDGPAPVGGASAPVQGNNNIAQRNITIVNAGDAAPDSWVGMIAGSRLDPGVATLVIDATRLRGAGAVRLCACTWPMP
jgi:hypothetical protein